MAGSRSARAGSKRTAGRRRAVGTRDRIIAHLAAADEIADPTGMASTRLAEAVGYPGSSVAFAQLLSGMERDGLIAREVRGKRTYRITLADGAAAARPGLAASLAAGPGTAIRPGLPAISGTGGRAELDGNGKRLPSPPAMVPAEFDYDELARRLLVQVVRRLAVTPADMQQTVAALELELATAWSRHGTLTAENVRLREELVRTQRDLDSARELGRKAAVSDELSDAEVVLLEGLLTPELGSEGQESGATAS
ncbi:MAG TPA: hypothetical protein VJ283_20175 [Trebonia sp.]|nr:hypothetical protein [Trebonia sp.]